MKYTVYLYYRIKFTDKNESIKIKNKKEEEEEKKRQFKNYNVKRKIMKLNYEKLNKFLNDLFNVSLLPKQKHSFDCYLQRHHTLNQKMEK